MIKIFSFLFTILITKSFLYSRGSGITGIIYIVLLAESNSNIFRTVNQALAAPVLTIYLNHVYEVGTIKWFPISVPNDQPVVMVADFL